MQIYYSLAANITLCKTAAIWNESIPAIPLFIEITLTTMCLREEWQSSKGLLREKLSYIRKIKDGIIQRPFLEVLDAAIVVKDVVKTFVLVCIPPDPLIILVTLQSLWGMVEVFGWSISPLAVFAHKWL